MKAIYITHFISFVITAFYFICEGIREAYYWLERAQHPKNFDQGRMHFLFGFQRACFFIALIFLNYYGASFHATVGMSLLHALLAGLGFWMIHFFFHLSTYYHMVNLLNPKLYPEGANSDASEESHSMLDKRDIFNKYWHRVFLIFAGGVVIAINLSF